MELETRVHDNLEKSPKQAGKSPFSAALKGLLAAACDDADARADGRVGTSHLLRVLLDRTDNEVARVFTDLEIDMIRLRAASATSPADEEENSSDEVPPKRRRADKVDRKLHYH